ESVRKICKPILSQATLPAADLMNSDLARAVRGYLSHYYYNFDDYDQISFPIFYETNFGESDIIDIIRISPEDARSLVQERDDNNRPTGRLKLAGAALHHFGAFFDRVWRQNDIMWGRLDGAERVITALLPNDETQKNIREALITEAHEIIIEEELMKSD